MRYVDRKLQLQALTLGTKPMGGVTITSVSDIRVRMLLRNYRLKQPKTYSCGASLLILPLAHHAMLAKPRKDVAIAT